MRGTRPPDLLPTKELACPFSAQSDLSKVCNGLAPTGRGLRARRVGEATHPGPGVAGPGLNVVMWNINSFLKHFDAVLARADQLHANIILLQETGVKANQIPSLAQRLRTRRWNIDDVPAFSNDQGGKGGVAILTREPLSFRRTHHRAEPWGQFLVGELLGASSTLTLICGYRMPGPITPEALEALSAAIGPCVHRNWLLGTDFNASAHIGAFAELMLELGGQVLATGGHVNSTTHIDSVWGSRGLCALKTRNLEVLSDHEGLQVSLSTHKPCQEPQSWEFRPHRPLIDSEQIDETQVHSEWDCAAPDPATWANLLQAMWKRYGPPGVVPLSRP